jgi:hypothetical protein
MSESMQIQIDEVVEELSPPLGSIGMLTTQDVRNLVQKAATKGTLIGWVAGEKLTVTRFKNQINECYQEYENLKSHCKQLEFEIMELKR